MTNEGSILDSMLNTNLALAFQALQDLKDDSYLLPKFYVSRKKTPENKKFGSKNHFDNLEESESLTKRNNMKYLWEESKFRNDIISFLGTSAAALQVVLCPKPKIKINQPLNEDSIKLQKNEFVELKSVETAKYSVESSNSDLYAQRINYIKKIIQKRKDESEIKSFRLQNAKMKLFSTDENNGNQLRLSALINRLQIGHEVLSSEDIILKRNLYLNNSSELLNECLQKGNKIYKDLLKQNSTNEEIRINIETELCSVLNCFEPFPIKNNFCLFNNNNNNNNGNINNVKWSLIENSIDNKIQAIMNTLTNEEFGWKNKIKVNPKIKKVIDVNSPIKNITNQNSPIKKFKKHSNTKNNNFQMIENEFTDCYYDLLKKSSKEFTNFTAQLMNRCAQLSLTKMKQRYVRVRDRPVSANVEESPEEAHDAADSVPPADLASDLEGDGQSSWPVAVQRIFNRIKERHVVDQSAVFFLHGLKADLISTAEDELRAVHQLDGGYITNIAACVQSHTKEIRKQYNQS